MRFSIKLNCFGITDYFNLNIDRIDFNKTIFDIEINVDEFIVFIDKHTTIQTHVCDTRIIELSTGSTGKNKIAHLISIIADAGHFIPCSLMTLTVISDGNL